MKPIISTLPCCGVVRLMSSDKFILKFSGSPPLTLYRSSDTVLIPSCDRYIGMGPYALWTGHSNFTEPFKDLAS